MARTATSAVAKTTPGGAVAMSDQVPDFMKPLAGQGTEKLGVADMEVPRIKLLQGLSPEVEEFESAKPGLFWHSMANVSLGKEVLIVPVYIDMRAILWRPRDDGGGILARADDNIHWSPPNAKFTVALGKKGTKQKQVTWATKPTVAASGLLEWGSSDPDDPSSQPAATKMYNMVVVCPEHPDIPPAVVTLQRASIKPARKFMGKLKMARAPSYGMLFTMSSVMETNKNGEKFQQFNFTPKGFLTDQSLFTQCQDLYEAFKRVGLKVADLEGMGDEAAVDGTGAATGEDATDADKY